MKKKINEISYKSIKERLLSDENIFLSIYLIDSYIENKELLSIDEQTKLAKLHDIFDVELIKATIAEVRNKLEYILSKNSYFEVSVYFKPKKYNEKDEVEFRPLHTASLIDQISIVAMLLVLVYDVDEYGRLRLSDLSRLLPAEFYGNKIACNTRELFKPWSEQYSEYSAKANELLNTYCETLEFKYEVNLDLKNFFPSINPKVLFNYIVKQLPLKLNSEDRETLMLIVKKLLFFRLKKLNEVESQWYLQKDKNEMVLGKCQYAKGLPQGLPHSYFMANIFMLIVRDAYIKIFDGKMLFYVDDSIIFTNGRNNELSIDKFEECIKEINKEINQYEVESREHFPANDLPEGYVYNNDDFGVKVHTSKDQSSKSAFSEICLAKENSGERYLRGLSRETSKMGFDMNTAFSDEEIRMMQSRTSAVCKLLDLELERINKDNNEEKYKVYQKKLLRYRKYFSYRKMILSFLSGGNVNKLVDKLVDTINTSRSNNGLKEIMEKFKDDILFAAINFALKNCEGDDKNTNRLVKAIKSLEKEIYGDNLKYSYITKVYERYIFGDRGYQVVTIDSYRTLKFQVNAKCRSSINQVKENINRRFKVYLSTLYRDNQKVYDSEQLFLCFGLQAVYKFGLYLIANTDELERMLLNCLYSYLFSYEVDDKLILAKKSRDSIQYSEIRILVALRSKQFSIGDFLSNYEDYVADEFMCTADYSLLQVLDIFRIFVSEYKWIDQLILIHKYCCDTWKNGSKYLHFYTLHNQEHAVCLIRTAIKLIHGISYFQLKRIDYFILFAACYLHDISMVTLPKMSDFYNKSNMESNNIYSMFNSKLEQKRVNIELMKKHMCDFYQRIDGYFEKTVRSRHAQNSASEIRKYSELNFLEPSIRELIAQVSEAHGYGVDSIYCSKPDAEESLINTKMIKILLRLSDLLDISRYRISKVILNHNLENLNEESRFHWISHLITDGYDFSTIYKAVPKNGKVSYLQNGNIKEQLEIRVKVLLSQTSKVDKKAGCKYVKASKLNSKKRMPEVTITCKKNFSCSNSECNFLCKWFTLKNNYLFEEFATLSDYLNSRQKDYFYASEVKIIIEAITDTEIPDTIFDYLREYVATH